MRISDMHSAIQEAVLERNSGLSADSDVAPEWALGEWSAWEIGDSYWARFVVQQLDVMRGSAVQ